MLLLMPLLVWSLSSHTRSPTRPIAALDSPTRHVRVLDTNIRHLLNDAYRRSPTLASLVDRLQASDVTVYVVIVPELPQPLRGRSELIPDTGHLRFVRIDVISVPNPDAMIALVAHELQHAIEIADAGDIVDRAGMERLYKRIGRSSGPKMFETSRAIDTQRRVREELRRHG